MHPVAAPALPAVDQRGRALGSSRLAIGATLVALAPIVVLLIATIAQADAYRPVSDDALIELHVRDVGSRMLLLGPYSRFGWYHPGPALFYVLAPAYRLLGSTVVGLPVSALALNAAAIVGSAVVAFRRGGMVLLLATLLGVVLLVGGLGGDAVRQAWNPTVTVLPFVLLVLLVWSAAEGDRWAVPIAVGVGSFVVQAHVGYAVVVTVLLAWGIGAAFVVGRRAGTRLAPVVLATGCVVVAFWALPVFEQLTRDPGNLGVAARFARDGASDHTAGEGWHVVAGALGWRVPWITGDVPLDLFTGEVVLSGGAAIPIGLVLLVGAITLAAARREWSALRLDVTVLLGLGAAIVSIGRVKGPVFPYLVLWLSALAMLAWLGVAWTAYRVLATRFDPVVPRAGAAVLGAALVVAAALVALGVASVEVPDAAQARAVRELTPEVLASVRDGRGPVVIDSFDQTPARGVASGLALQLERHGIAVEASPADSLRFGPGRRAGGSRPRARLYVGSVRATPPGPHAGEWARVASVPIPRGPFSGNEADVTVYRRRG